MHKIRVAFVFGAIFLSVAASTSFAATTKTREPLSPAQENIDKNAQKKPGNKGLHSAKSKTSKIINKNTIFLALMAANLFWATVSAAPGAWTDDDKFSLTTGFDYSAGKYGSANATDMLSTTAATSEYETGQWMFKVAVPYARITSTGSTATGIGLARTGATARDVQSDLGDPVAAASYNIYSGRSSTFGIDLTGKVKLKTADAGLDIGQNDYAAQADAYQSFNKFTALGSLGYMVL